jgi:catechol 2,3-dioxygenase-like lactoylglutathione lyase family enzyme
MKATPMNRYVDPIEQLVTEVFAADISRSVDYYRRLGFRLRRDGGDFVELAWEDHAFFVAEASTVAHVPRAGSVPRALRPTANVRVMVPDVDRSWTLAAELRLPVIVPIADRHYGLRDFTIADPDGFGIRFASLLP